MFVGLERCRTGQSVQERLGSYVCKRMHGGTNATVTHPREMCCALVWLEYQSTSYTKTTEHLGRAVLGDTLLDRQRSLCTGTLTCTGGHTCTDMRMGYVYDEQV